MSPTLLVLAAACDPPATSTGAGGAGTNTTTVTVGVGGGGGAAGQGVGSGGDSGSGASGATGGSGGGAAGGNGGAAAGGAGGTAGCTNETSVAYNLFDGAAGQASDILQDGATTHVVLQSNWFEPTRHAERNGSSAWTLSDIGAAVISWPKRTSIVLDGNGTLHTMTIIEASMYYGTRLSGGSWTQSNFNYDAASFYEVESSPMVLAPDGGLHLGHHYDFQTNYAHLTLPANSNMWVNTQLLSVFQINQNSLPTAGYFARVVVDSQNGIHSLATVDFDDVNVPPKLSYNYKPQNGSWSLVNDTPVAMNPFEAMVDAQDTIHLVRSGNYYIKTASSTVFTLVEQTPAFGFSQATSDIGMDAAGNLFILALGGIWRRTPQGQWSSQPLANASRMAVTADGTVYATVHDIPLLKVARICPW